MYTSISGFLNDWQVESSMTLQVLDKLTDESLKQAVSAAQARTLGELGWHLVDSIPVFLNQIGTNIAFSDPATRPSTAAAIAEAYRRANDAALSGLAAAVADDRLPQPFKMFGFIDTTVAGVLNMLVRHQIHHRAQMTILMRQAGLAAPGLYGPNEEETAAMHAARE